MLEIGNDGAIRITAGDSITLDVALTADNGEAYIIEQGDTVTAHITNGADDYDLTADSYSGNVAQIVLDTAFTRALRGTYLYDMVITFSSGGQYTLTRPASFVVLKGVDC